MPDVARTSVSWVTATWVTPLVPALVLLVAVLLGAQSDPAGGHVAGALLVLGGGLGTCGLGALLWLTSSRVVSGVGVGLVAGGSVSALVALSVLI